MGVVLAGIDEAGYGPLLGPLAVGLSVFRVETWPPRAGQSPPTSESGADGTWPDLWNVLKRGVCREPGRAGKPDAKGRIAIADSKQLKLANSVRTTHPLVHLERGVLAMHRAMDDAQAPPPSTDCELHSALGTTLPTHDCYRGDGIPLPLANDAALLATACNILRSAFGASGVGLRDLRCAALSEAEFNAAHRARTNKADTNGSVFGRHLRRVWDRWAGSSGDRLGIVCDRLGGRASYADFLGRELGADIAIVEETDRRSKYIATDSSGRRAGIVFLVEAESCHLPVALASMTAKYIRELAMVRFNRHWTARSREHPSVQLKPTAGYSFDARRWLNDAAPLLTPRDRAELVRVV